MRLSLKEERRERRTAETGTTRIFFFFILTPVVLSEETRGFSPSLFFAFRLCTCVSAVCLSFSLTARRRRKRAVFPLRAPSLKGSDLSAFLFRGVLYRRVFSSSSRSSFSSLGSFGVTSVVADDLANSPSFLPSLSFSFSLSALLPPQPSTCRISPEAARNKKFAVSLAESIDLFFS